jgi:uncharacterized protein (TIGR03083 family)
VESSRYLEALSEESGAFFDAVAKTTLDALVPSCPDWTVEDLVYHLGEVHYFWGEIAARHLAEPDVSDPVRPGADHIVGWALEQAATLQRVLSQADPATPVWTWSTQHDIAFIIRRMAQETAVHRWDAQRAAGVPEPIEAELASDGIDEFLTLFFAHPKMGSGSIGGSVHVHATDTPGEWLVEETDDGVTVTAQHAKGDAALRGPANDLLLALWRRVGPDTPEVIGDRGVADRFLSRTSLD